MLEVVAACIVAAVILGCIGLWLHDVLLEEDE
jgi:hypothetical protein